MNSILDTEFRLGVIKIDFICNAFLGFEASVSKRNVLHVFNGSKFDRILTWSIKHDKNVFLLF